MSLADLIRGKSARDKFATATSATFATLAGERGRTVASVATVAVANPHKPIPEPIPASPAKVGAGGAAVTREPFDREAREEREERAVEEPPKPDPWRVTRCGDCGYFKRIDHPHLGHCATGEPEPLAGLWDSDQRYCAQYRVVQIRG